jgi:hypothetical protein
MEMRLLNLMSVLVFAGCSCAVAHGQLQMLPATEAPCVFGGAVSKINIVWRNPGAEAADVPVRTQLYQADSATVVPLGPPRDWKQLRVLPGQTVLETISLELPSVKAATRFLLQWLDASNQVLGLTDLFVYPTNLLWTLIPLAGGKPLGVFDPQNQLRPLLNRAGVEFEDLAENTFVGFSGRLGIIGPIPSGGQGHENLPEKIRSLALKGTAIVWIQPSAVKEVKLQPSFYSVPVNQIAVVVVQADLLADLPTNPQSQLNLLYFCGIALNPQPPALPHLAAQP